MKKRSMLSMLSLLIFAMVFISEIVFASSNISAMESQIVKKIELNESSAISLLERVVNINSGTMNIDGVRKVGSIFEDEFKKLGFKVTWIDGKPFKRAGHLLAEYGTKGPKLLLIGHLDTVFAKDSPLQSYTPTANNHIMGPGITDMKGGDVVMLYALRALHESGVLDTISVRVILTGDEEKRGRPLALATKVLLDAGEWADIAIGFEDGDGDPKTAVVSRRGSSGWSLNVTGKANHSSQIFRQDYGYGAIFETARILNAFREALSTVSNLTFSPGLILGGTEIDLDNSNAKGTSYGKTNVIAKTTRVIGDIRALRPEQLTHAHKVMRDITSNNLNQTSASIDFTKGYPPMAPSDGNHKLLAIYNQISLDLGYGKVESVDPRKAGAADISFVAEQVDMAIDGLGLMGSGGHTELETADMATLPQQTKRAALLFYRLGRMPL
ncbi:MAG: glutamate carboxypeptidase [Flavobacterium sp.]|jgi:glutamate carboxypeptidase